MSRLPLIITSAVAILIVGLILVLVGILPGRRSSAPAPVTLEFWGFDDDERTWQDIIKGFTQQNPHITVSYHRLPTEKYEDTLLNKLAEGKGPDIFLLQNSSLVKHMDKIIPLPQKTLNISLLDLKQTFVDKATDELTGTKGEIFGLPLFMDTLALFYNKDVFNAAGIAEPPKTWDEVVEISRKLTAVKPSAGIVRSGLSIGSFRNVEHALEIISAMILQNGDKIINPKTKAVNLTDNARSALLFYTSFADENNQNFSWNERMPNSIDAFAEGSAAMAFGFSDDIKRIAAKNPHLNFAVVAFPQPRDIPLPVTYGRYLFPAVSKLSKYPVESWQFILFAASSEEAKDYIEKSNRPPARRDLIRISTSDPEREIFYRQALIAQNWPIPDYDASYRIFQEAVESVVARSAKPQEAIAKLGEQLGLILP